MEKVDYKRELNGIYSASAKQCSLITIPGLTYFMIDGVGDPNTSVEFQEAVEALFSVSYTLKFMVKKSTGADYGVMPLEGLWWCPDMALFDINKKEDWHWTAMIMQPDINQVFHEAAVEKVRKDKGLLALNRMRSENYREGLAAQVMHIGPFSEEGPTIEKLHQFITVNECIPSGKHHEIYLSDIRRGKPESWKTILRQPVLRL